MIYNNIVNILYKCIGNAIERRLHMWIEFDKFVRNFLNNRSGRHDTKQLKMKQFANMGITFIVREKLVTKNKLVAFRCANLNTYSSMFQ